MNNRNADNLREKLYEAEYSPEEIAAMATAEKEKADAAYTADFWNCMHTGVAVNTMSKESGTSGGYLVPDSFDSKIVDCLRENNIVRRLATVIPTERKMQLPTITRHTTAQWVDENHPYIVDDMAYGRMELDAYKLTAKSVVTDELLEDNGVHLEEFLINDMVEAIAEMEEEAFLVGDGIGKPKGIVYQAQVGAKSLSEGNISVEDIISLVYSVKTPYREKGVLVMSTDAYIKLSQYKTGYGKYLWNEDITEGADAKLLDYDVYVSKYLDSVASGSKPVLYGDFSRFIIGDRGKRTLKRLEEKYADYGQVGFIMAERTDGLLTLPEAVKSLEIS